MVKGNVFIIDIRKQTLRGTRKCPRAESERSRLNSRLDMARALWTRGQQQEIEKRENSEAGARSMAGGAGCEEGEWLGEGHS